ncbi:hypothetical protein ACLB90_06175 [Stenotrophomonas sp. LGBM10]|uniref:hypothetical protein n=1 Tax=Stenotrophomonas sp. LGBM10 TaxID=3390038 RepID=UPI00398A5D48
MELKHSGLGIAAFCLALGCALIMLLSVIGATVASMQGIEMNEESPLSMMIGLVIICAGFGELIALALGIAAAFVPATKKVFGILAIVISIGSVIGMGLLVIAGLMMG